ncbi:hypothetical protein [Sphingomonas xanthus]|uniref:Uncharacterized protein n=1 Tax=Sphingomonas xanthus TaxID=2594473 RepID=A0A516ITK1_9SPHN|nr:hypothetical protein [Sphingomonas xanthus]QDP20223.1 hypothetical protein FMM02_09820 [Sphingomonas xanthus]
MASLVLSQAADACIPPPPPIRLPDESPEAFKVRSTALLDALSDEERRSYQAALYDRSDRIFLGVVANSEAIDAAGTPGHRVTVRPIASLKGGHPTEPLVLADRYLTSCGKAGGGSATSARTGDYVLVLEGDLFRQGPQGFGFQLNDLREPRLLAGLETIARQLASHTVPGHNQR